ncbi:hypothetical protein [Paenibacillus sp. RC67]|nr:hypothetical protein [Paenibacillus sp. RC67]
MNAISYFLHHYALSIVLLLGIIAAIFFVYKNWDKIIIKGSGRK